MGLRDFLRRRRAVSSDDERRKEQQQKRVEKAYEKQQKVRRPDRPGPPDPTGGASPF